MIHDEVLIVYGFNVDGTVDISFIHELLNTV